MIKPTTFRNWDHKTLKIDDASKKYHSPTQTKKFLRISIENSVKNLGIYEFFNINDKIMPEIRKKLLKALKKNRYLKNRST